MSPDISLAHYWPFAVLCAVALVAVVRLLVRETITLQGSISFGAFLVVFLVAALLPERAFDVARAMGFTLLSNFLFALALIGLSILHLRGRIALSRADLRTVQLTQELALLEERVRRMSGER